MLDDSRYFILALALFYKVWCFKYTNIIQDDEKPVRPLQHTPVKYKPRAYTRGTILKGSSTRTRTWNLAVNSRPLCRIELSRNTAKGIINSRGRAVKKRGHFYFVLAGKALLRFHLTIPLFGKPLPCIIISASYPAYTFIRLI
jgi:hypothetical protein